MRKTQIQDFMDSPIESYFAALEDYLQADIICFAGSFFDGLELEVRKKIEQLRNESKKTKTLYVILTTSGGSATTVERCVHIIRHHYKKVHFIVPDYAYSAGTLFCLSGDRIFMDYYGVLGPIDPQVRNRHGYFMPAAGYTDKTNQLIEKSKREAISPTELALLKGIDFADISYYEQAQDLSIALAKQWLVEYNLKRVKESEDEATPHTITRAQKKEFAQSIGEKLCDTSRWLSHSRPIHKKILEEEVALLIFDFDEDKKLSTLIKKYYYELDSLIKTRSGAMFLQTRLDCSAILPIRQRKPQKNRKSA